MSDIKIEPNHIYNMDCLEGMKYMPDKSVDCIICDLPYGTTACKWDNVLPLNDYVVVDNKTYEEDDYFKYAYIKNIPYTDAVAFFKKNKELGLWSHYKRIIKDNGAVVLFGSEPFTTQLISSNIENFKYEIIWEKTLSTNFMLVKKQVAKKHENICVFYKKQPTYNPQMEEGTPYIDKARKRTVGVHGDAITTKNLLITKEQDILLLFKNSVMEITTISIQHKSLLPWLSG